MRKGENQQEDGSCEDEVRPEEGLVRSWMFLNGEQVRLFFALAAAFLGVLWSFLYVLGAAESIVSTIVLVLGVASFVLWRILDRELREYEKSGWRKDKHSPRRDRFAIRIAIVLWLFIGISLSVIFFLEWRSGH